MLTEYLKDAYIGTDLQLYVQARLTFFHEHEKEARLFFESILQPPIHLKDEIAKLREEFDEFNQKLYRQILDSIILRSDVTKEDAIRYFSLVQEMFNGYFSSPAISGRSYKETMMTHEKGLSKMLDFMLYGIASRGEKI